MSLSAGRFLFTYYPVTLVLMNQSCLEFDILLMQVERLKMSSIDYDSNSDKQNESVLKELVDIIERSCSVFDWQNDLQKLLSFHFFVDFSVLSSLFCTCLYVIATNPLVSTISYLALFVTIVPLYGCCWMGSRVVHRIELLQAALYDLPWYMMNIALKKRVLTMLVMAQNIRGFNGIFNAVELKTFEKVCYFLCLFKNFCYNFSNRSWSFHSHCTHFWILLTKPSTTTCVMDSMNHWWVWVSNFENF